jgi:DNA polymerase
MVSSEESLVALAWLIDAGADEAIGDTPVDRLTAVARTNLNPPLKGGSKSASQISGRGLAEPRSAPSPKTPPAFSTLPQGEGKKTTTPTASPAILDSDEIGNAQVLAGQATSLAELKAAVEAFEGCGLKKTATNTVFADGTPSHRIMLIGEAPGRDEDMQGLPFVGRAGQLLDKMLASINLSRKENVYITNVLNWRPPGNRDPSPEEAAACLPFLRRHIELADPEIIVLLGATAARHVMGRSDGIMRLRGKWLEYHVNGRMVPVMPTLHPAYLLRRAIDKKLAWRDLQAIESKILSLNLLEKRALSG